MPSALDVIATVAWWLLAYGVCSRITIGLSSVQSNENRPRIVAVALATGVVLLGKFWWGTILPGLWYTIMGGLLILVTVGFIWGMANLGKSSCRRICDESRCWRVCDDGPQDGGYIGYSHVNEPERWK